MHCPQCGEQTTAGAKFCPACGAALSEVPELTARNNPLATRMKANRDEAAKDLPEDELWSDTYSPKAMFGPFLVADLITVAAVIGVIFFWPDSTGWLALGTGLVLLWGLFVLTLLYRRLSIQYRLTRFRFFISRGIFSRRSDRIETIDIDDVTVHQGLIERMLNVGTIIISSSDRSDPELRMPGIDNAKEVADLIDNTRRKERQRRGLHIESI